MQVQHFSVADGARLAYADEGEGTPVLCLTGLTRNMNDFNHVAPFLKGRRMIRMDYRGRGKSDWTGVDTYTVPQEAADAVALLDHLGVQKAAIIGTSRGGLIGMFMGVTARDRMLGLCLNDVGPALHAPGLEHIIDYIGRRPSARSMEDLAGTLERNAVGFSDVPPGRWLEEAHHQFRQGPDGIELCYDAALREGFIEAMKDPTATAWPLFDALAGLPLALIRGEGSNLLTAETADEMKRRRPDMILATVPGRGHIPYLDEPESQAALEEWLARIESTL